MLSDSLTVYPVGKYYLSLIHDLCYDIHHDCAAISAFFPVSDPAVRALHVLCNRIHVYAGSVGRFDPLAHSVSDLDRDRAVLSRLYDSLYDFIMTSSCYKPHFMRIRLCNLQHSVVLLLETLASFIDHLNHCRDSILII